MAVDCAPGNAHDPGDFLGGQICQVVEGGGGALATGKSAESESQLRVSQSGLDPNPGAGALKAFPQSGTAGDDSAVVAAPVERDAIEPGNRVSQIANGIPAQIELEERILGGVPGQFSILRYERETLHQPHRMLLDEAFEASICACRGTPPSCLASSTILPRTSGIHAVQDHSLVRRRLKRAFFLTRRACRAAGTNLISASQPTALAWPHRLQEARTATLAIRRSG